MAFIPRRSKTESIVPATAGFMEFQLDSDLGYQEWCGMFHELGVKASLFLAYAIQSQADTMQISTTPVQLHHYQHSIFIAPPFAVQEYYWELSRANLRLGKVYFRVPKELDGRSLEGFKPEREALYAMDIWVIGENGIETIYSFFYEARIRTDKIEYQIERFDITKWRNGAMA